MNPLRRLHTEQQSPWLDDLTREQLANGALHRLIDRGIRGLTSNPSTFARAVAVWAGHWSWPSPCLPGAPRPPERWQVPPSPLSTSASSGATIRASGGCHSCHSSPTPSRTAPSSARSWSGDVGSTTSWRCAPCPRPPQRCSTSWPTCATTGCWMTGSSNSAGSTRTNATGLSGRVRLKGPFGIAREARTRVLSARPPADGSPGRLAGRADIGTTTTGRVSWEIAAGQDGGSLVTLAALAERVSLLDRVLLVCGRWWLQRTFDRALLNLDRILSPYVSPSPSRVSLRGCMQSRRPGDAGLEAQAEHGPGSPRRQPDDASGSRAWHCATGLRPPGETGRTSGLPRRTPSGTERTATPSGSSPNTAAAPPMCATSRPIPGCGSRSGDSGARAPLPCCPATILGSGNASSAAGSTQRLARLMGTDLLTVRIDLDEPMIGLRGRDMTTPRREAPEPFP